MGRGHKNTSQQEPERRCIATGVTRPKDGLIRFVLDPDGGIVPDLSAKLPGRGIWVAADRAALDRAIAKKLFARAAKRTVAIPDGLTDMVETGLTRRVTDLLSFARKAGEAVSGYEKVRGWLQTGEAVVLLQASDGSERGKTKLRLPSEDGPTLQCLTARGNRFVLWSGPCNTRCSDRWRTHDAYCKRCQPVVRLAQRDRGFIPRKGR